MKTATARHSVTAKGPGNGAFLLCRFSRFCHSKQRHGGEMFFPARLPKLTSKGFFPYRAGKGTGKGYRHGTGKIWSFEKTQSDMVKCRFESSKPCAWIEDNFSLI